MSLAGASIRRPVSVAVGILLAALFGTLSLLSMPVQMKPTVDQPEISVETTYPGAAPAEIEEEITSRIEEKLTTVENLKELRSTSSEGRSRISCLFEWGTNKDLAAIDVQKKLAAVERLPEDLRPPVVSAASSDEQSPVVWMNLASSLPVETQKKIADDVIKPRLERIEDVGWIRVWGGREREIQVVVDNKALAARGITLEELDAALFSENRNVRGGHIDEGKRRVVLRTLGQFESLKDVENTIVSKTDGRPVYVRDVAAVRDDFKEVETIVRGNGVPTLSVAAFKKSGANSLAVVNAIKAEVEKLNAEFAGRDLAIRVTFDEGTYILAAIETVAKNLAFGALLAALALVFFLRSFSSIAAIAIAIPVAGIATFIFLKILGRSVNVISLAGLAFAGGMVVDNAIVVLENIVRHRESGKSRFLAALDGTKEVYGAALASTLTTLAVFVPIIFIQEEAGQLFKDIAITISVAVALSLLVSVTFIPTYCARFLKLRKGVHAVVPGYGLPEDSLGGARPTLADRFRLASKAFIDRSTDRTWKKLAWIAGLTGLFLASTRLLPAAEYLPPGNRNLVFLNTKLAPGTNLDAADRVTLAIEERLLPMPERHLFFSVTRPEGSFYGMTVKPEYAEDIDGVVDKIRGAVSGIPGADILVFKSNLFTRGIGGKEVEVQVIGKDPDELKALAESIEASVRALPGVEGVRSSVNPGNPELRVRLDRERMSDLGLTASDVANVVETLVEGKRATFYRERGDEIDLTVIGDRSLYTDPGEIRDVLVVAADGRKVPLTSVAWLERAEGLSQIDHIEQERAVSLRVIFDRGIPLESAIRTVDEKVLSPLRSTLPPTTFVRLSGSADDLSRTKAAVTRSFVVALLIVYLLMAALFESFLYPLFILLTVPLAMTGAILGVVLRGAELNVITMLGFIILGGIVVNNAILIVHQTLVHLREGNGPRESILEACGNRVRPILMTSLTTIAGMMPLVVGSGAGTELYRGLGAAIAGGLALSTLFTLFLVPSLLDLWFAGRRRAGALA